MRCPHCDDGYIGMMQQTCPACKGTGKATAADVAENNSETLDRIEQKIDKIIEAIERLK